MGTSRNQHAFTMLLVMAMAGCGRPAEEAGSTSTSPNAEVLDEVNQAQSWFHAKKVRPVWVKLLKNDQTVKTIEGVERVKAGDYLCRGAAGEFWPQSAKSLTAKYQKTEEVDAEGWRRYVPRPDNQGVMAAQVPHAFTIHARWGVLSGKAGDYLIKNFTDRDVAHPDDVWIVDQGLFQATYQRVGTEPPRGR